MKPVYFSIPKPCSEDWNKMTPTEQGAFCTQCNKEVVDLYPVPSDQIKRTIAAKNNPCVRILQHQIDEMNFMEWFRSLRLVKQLRYTFLFTFILVFQVNSQAQEADTTFIPYSNEYLDEIETKLAESEVDSTAENYVMAHDTTAYQVVIPDWNEIIMPPIGEGWMGVPPMPPIGIWDIGWETETEIALIGGGLVFEHLPEDNPIPFKNKIIFDKNIYAFEIVQDELRFTYISVKHQNLKLSISNENGEIVYFQPIEVGIGENTISYPIDKFKFGHYTITLRLGNSWGETKVIYL